jgi:NADPH-dependent glutamate synthase beta subunit-like oxidoreductase
LLAEEGIEFVTSAHIGKNVNVDVLVGNSDATVLAMGSTKPRDLSIKGRDAKGVHFAMEFLTANQKRLLVTAEGNLSSIWDGKYVSAEGKNVSVIGGGDTGTDCIGTSMRHRCKSIVNFELMPCPPSERSGSNPWPEWPRVFGVDYGHAEVAAVFGEDPRQYGLMTQEFKTDAAGKRCGLVTVGVEVGPDGIKPVPGTEKEWPCDLAILAMGFVSPEEEILKQLKVATDQRNNVHAE